MENYAAVKKEQTIATCNNLDESQRNHAEWKKSNLKSLDAVWFCSYNILEITKL